MASSKCWFSQKRLLLSADKSLEPFWEVAVVENQRCLGLCKPFEGQFPQSALSAFLDVSSRLAVVHPNTLLCQYRKADETTPLALTLQVHTNSLICLFSRRRHKTPAAVSTETLFMFIMPEPSQFGMVIFYRTRYLSQGKRNGLRSCKFPVNFVYRYICARQLTFTVILDHLGSLN